MSISIGHITLKEEKDVVLARQWTKEIASLSKGGSGQMAATDARRHCRTQSDGTAIESGCTKIENG